MTWATAWIVASLAVGVSSGTFEDPFRKNEEREREVIVRRMCQEVTALFEDVTAGHWWAKARRRLSKHADHALPVLLQLTRSSEPIVRRKAMCLLGEFGGGSPNALYVMVKLAEGDSDASVREVAFRALSHVPRHKAVVRVAVLGMKDDDPGIRVAAATAYWNAVKRSAPVVAVASAVLKDPRCKKAHRCSLRLLGHVARENGQATQVLCGLLHSSFAATAADELAAVGPLALVACPRVRWELLRLFDATDSLTRHSAMCAYWSITSDWATLQQALRRALRTDDLFLLRYSLRLVIEARQHVSPLLSELLKCLFNEDREVQVLALRALFSDFPDVILAVLFATADRGE